MSNTRIHKEKGKSNRYWEEARKNPDRYVWWSPRVWEDWERLFARSSWDWKCRREWKETGEDRAERKRREAKIHLEDRLKDVWSEYYYWKNRNLDAIFEEEEEFERKYPDACEKGLEQWDWWYEYCLEEE